ncbi:hypothetical protein IU501_12425 [Nocardia otitidiscaviarum]|uniref:hypothetical protein n=2 Tax=Nocardia otitidiscaviarum TaxID=1823 RepID=UPI000AB70363|nr:hypothetical protein [Nocardia otitidiscaviarum]MBF6133803.1 hypothetical protein [Nocardia otitidiscaviarum]MBF6487831.1 hypothetical protein [Nocardia otitidiscaviarum]
MADAGAVSPGPGEQGIATFTAATFSGSIKVRTTEQGLPMAIRVNPAELHRDPSQLAAEVLRLCQRSAARAGAERRKQLEEAGVSAETLQLSGLPTEADVARLELVEEQEYETEPQSWLGTV